MDALEMRLRWGHAGARAVREAVLRGDPGDAQLDLRGIDLRSADLRGRSLRRARLDFARLDGADLRGADLTLASLAFASGFKAGFAHACLTDADLAQGNFAGARFVEADLQRASLVNASFAGADLRAANLHAAVLRGCDLGGAWLWGATLDRDEHKLSDSRRAAVEAGYPALYELLEGGGYLALLGLGTAETARMVEGAAWGARLLDREVLSLLADPHWRLHIAAAAALCLATERLRAPSTCIAACWGAIDRGSWVCPQLAAACFLLDQDYERRAAAARRAAGDDKLHEALDALARGTAKSFATKWLTGVRAHAGEAARRCWARWGAG